MARDDYFVIVYKILSYLYKCLKAGTSPDESYLNYYTKDFPIDESYWSYTWEHMVKDGFIENVGIIQVDDTYPIVKIEGDTRITPTGIEYLQDNSSMRKVEKFLKEAIQIVKP